LNLLRPTPIRSLSIAGNEIKTEFLKWLEKHPELGKMTRVELDKMMSKRTW